MIYSTLAVGLFASAAASFPTNVIKEREIGPAGRVKNFADVPASADLCWTPCYGRFHCANLQVPLDYENKTAGTTTVAWIRQEATNKTSKADIIFNPGGPGISGINSILNGGGDKLDLLYGGNFNIVAFDPRGVNNSGIDLTCWPGKPAARDEYASRPAGNTEQEKYAEAVALGKWCTNVANSKGSEIRYAGTSAAVQDMMYFTELQAVKDGKKKEDALINYYGVSYGTVIGQTLAQMFPNRLGRIILDANVQGDDHFNGMSDNSVEDADKTMENFFKFCAEAGPKKCAYAGSSKDAADIKKRFDALLAKLEKEPLQSVDPALGSPAIITKDLVLSQIFSWLYTPTRYFAPMASALDLIERGNTTGLYILIAGLTGTSNPGPNNYTGTSSAESQHLITSVDAAGRFAIKNVDDYMKEADKIEKSSVYFGMDYAGLNPLFNAGMNIQPPKSQLFPGK